MIEFKPRYFVLPAIALTVLAMLYAPADGGRAGACGPAVRIADPGHPGELRGVRSARQSATAGKVCALPPTIRCADKRTPHQPVNPNTKETVRCVSW